MCYIQCIYSFQNIFTILTVADIIRCATVVDIIPATAVADIIRCATVVDIIWCAVVADYLPLVQTSIWKRIELKSNQKKQWKKWERIAGKIRTYSKQKWKIQPNWDRRQSKKKQDLNAFACKGGRYCCFLVFQQMTLIWPFKVTKGQTDNAIRFVTYQFLYVFIVTIALSRTESCFQQMTLIWPFKVTRGRTDLAICFTTHYFP